MKEHWLYRAGTSNFVPEISSDMKEVLRLNSETLERGATRQVPDLHFASRTACRRSEKKDAMASVR